MQHSGTDLVDRGCRSGMDLLGNWGLVPCDSQGVRLTVLASVDSHVPSSRAGQLPGPQSAPRALLSLWLRSEDCSSGRGGRGQAGVGGKTGKAW